MTTINLSSVYNNAFEMIMTLSWIQLRTAVPSILHHMGHLTHEVTDMFSDAFILHEA